MDQRKLITDDNLTKVNNTQQRANHSKDAAAAVSPEQTSIRSTQPSHARIVQNFLVVWLDKNVDEDRGGDYSNAVTQLRQVINSVNTFTDADQCINFVTDVMEEKVFIIVSETLGQTIVPIVQDIPQVASVYIFCEKKVQHKQWEKRWCKVKGVFTDITHICEALRQAAQECKQNSIPISFVETSSETSNIGQDQLDQSFMYTQILKEILLSIDFEQPHINEFLSYCRKQFADNPAELRNVDKFEKEYHDCQPIWWYTYSYFLYSMLNRALRTTEVDLIIKMGFFIQDLHKHIVELHSEQYAGHHRPTSFTVYRGQSLSVIDFEQLRKAKGGLMSFNNFLSTSLDRAVSLCFAEPNQDNPDLVGVLFEIIVDTSVSSISFANTLGVSAFRMEKEILFSTHSVFRIGQIKQIDGNDRLWQVELKLTSDDDRDLRMLADITREETRGSIGWDRLGKLLIKIGKFEKAEELYRVMLDQTSNDAEKAHFYHQLGYIKEDLEDYEAAIDCYEKSLKIKEDALLSNELDFALSYNNIGSVYDKKGEYLTAISFYKKSLEIYREKSPEDDRSLATCCSNISLAYRNMGEYEAALSLYEKALAIDQRTLPKNHPSLAISYNNMGLIYDDMKLYSDAVASYEKALKIYEKTLPPNHLYLSIVYSNIGWVYNSLEEYSKALSAFKKSLEIGQQSLSSNHPNLAIFFDNIGSTHEKMEEYSKALSFYDEALEIRKKALPPNHPSLSIAFSKIGSVYNSMGKYSKALSYYEKATEIAEKSFPPSHSYLTQLYNNIGSVYKSMGDYWKAQSYFDRTLGAKGSSHVHNQLTSIISKES